MKPLKFLTALSLVSQLALAKNNTAHHGDYPIHSVESIEVIGEHASHSHLYEVVPAVSYISGEELFLKSDNSLGETLNKLPGVNSTQFGPTASRPVIRGLGGDRIRILQNGLGVIDASGTSEDHAVPLSPMAADSIEVIRGPINLLYGSSAIGGVVNVVNSRVHRHYDQGFFGGIDIKSRTVNKGKNVAAKLDYGVNNTMFHVDGNYSKTQNLNTPGNNKEIKNSQSEMHELAGGVTYLTSDEDYYGLSYSDSTNVYGVVAEEDVTINMNQRRIDFMGKIHLDGCLEAIQIKSAQSFYQHKELEGAEVGTTFKNTGNESRIEAIHSGNFLNGILGLQINLFDFSASGSEAFLPTTKNQATAIFAYEEYTTRSFNYNFGLRLEHNSSKALAGSFTSQEIEKSYFNLSVATGTLYKATKDLFFTFNISYNERAPTYQELYSNGAHIATSTFEVGSVDLPKENSLGTELSLRQIGKQFTTVFTIFAQDFSSFNNLFPTGAFDDTDGSSVAGDSPDDFPVYNYTAIKAQFYGAELETSYKIDMASAGKSRLLLGADYLVGSNKTNNQNLPRISPFRSHLEWQHHYNNLEFRLGLAYVGKQTRLAPNETQTSDYFMVHLGGSYKFDVGNKYWTVFLQSKNLFDVEARNHISLIKDRMQLGGRDTMLGLRGYF